MIGNIETFYVSKEWRTFRQLVISERLNEEGYTIDEVTGEKILSPYDIILHHKVELTAENVGDTNISLNSDNIMIVSHKTHNIIHNKLGYKQRGVWLVYGSALSGKTTYVNNVMCEGDLVIDMDNIWQCVSGCDRYNKPQRLNAIVFGIRDYLIDCIKYRRGKWNNAYLIGGYPMVSERQRLCRELGAREVFIDTPKQECINRLLACEQRDTEKWKGYINEWFDRYTPTDKG